MQLVDFLLSESEQLDSLFVFPFLDILVRIVADGIEMGEKTRHTVVNADDFVINAAVKLIYRRLRLRKTFGMDKVAHSLGAGQVELAIEEGALCVFASDRKTGTCLLTCLEQFLHDSLGAVAIDFRHFFTRVALFCEKHGKATVDDLVIARKSRAVEHFLRLFNVLRSEDFIENIPCVVTRKAHDADSTRKTAAGIADDCIHNFLLSEKGR